MNQKYDTDFPEPKQYKTEGFRIPSLLGEGKMSKSIEGSYINITDDLETIKGKLAKVPTDLGQGEKLPEKGGVFSLLTFVEYFQGEKNMKRYTRQME